jgi:hypothetical protein
MASLHTLPQPSAEKERSAEKKEKIRAEIIPRKRTSSSSSILPIAGPKLKVTQRQRGGKKKAGEKTENPKKKFESNQKKKFERSNLRA